MDDNRIQPFAPDVGAERPLRAVADAGDGSSGAVVDEVAAEIVAVGDEHLRSSDPPSQKTGWNRIRERLGGEP
jgi:hypothetical protein